MRAFYVQDVLYAAGAWKRRSGDVQDVLYAAGEAQSMMNYKFVFSYNFVAGSAGAAMYRMYGRFLLPAKPAFPPSLVVACRGRG